MVICLRKQPHRKPLAQGEGWILVSGVHPRETRHKAPQDVNHMMLASSVGTGSSSWHEPARFPLLNDRSSDWPCNMRRTSGSIASILHGPKLYLRKQQALSTALPVWQDECVDCLRTSLVCRGCWMTGSDASGRGFNFSEQSSCLTEM